MFSLFIILMSFSKSLARVANVSDQTKCIFLNDEPCMGRPALTDVNTVQLKYYSFMVSLNKCTGSFNVLSTKIYVPKETKDVNFKVFNMIINMKLKQ